MLYLITAGFIVLDLITGLIKAFKEKAYSSSVMREGLFHKGGSVLLVVFGCLIDYAQTFVDLGYTVPVATGFCIYIIVMEIGSIFENVGKINPDIMPDKVKEHFEKLSKKG